MPPLRSPRCGTLPARGAPAAPPLQARFTRTAYLLMSAHAFRTLCRRAPSPATPGAAPGGPLSGPPLRVRWVRLRRRRRVSIAAARELGRLPVAEGQEPPRDQARARAGPGARAHGVGRRHGLRPLRLRPLRPRPQADLGDSGGPLRRALGIAQGARPVPRPRPAAHREAALPERDRREGPRRRQVAVRDKSADEEGG